jgi:hypothetical protein
MKICIPCFQQCGLCDNADCLNLDRKFSHPLCIYPTHSGIKRAKTLSNVEDGIVAYA